MKFKVEKMINETRPFELTGCDIKTLLPHSTEQYHLSKVLISHYSEFKIITEMGFKPVPAGNKWPKITFSLARVKNLAYRKKQLDFKILIVS
jgi:hypothetical protein